MFVAQTLLEKNQKEEEDKLYRQFLEEREKMIKRLEDELRIEKEKNVKDLISDFEKISHKQDRTGLEKETAKLEQHYKRKREERLRHLIEKLTAEEKARVAKLIEKHSQEMLLMIAEKLTSVTEVCTQEPVFSSTVSISVENCEMKLRFLFSNSKTHQYLGNFNV